MLASGKNLYFMLIYFSSFGMYMVVNRIGPQELSIGTAASLVPVFGAFILAIHSIIGTGFGISSNYDDLPFPPAFYLLHMLIGQVWGFIFVVTGLLLLAGTYWHNIFQPSSVDILRSILPPIEIPIIIIFWFVVGLKSTIYVIFGAISLASSIIMLFYLIVYVHSATILLTIIPIYGVYWFIMKGSREISI